LYNYRLDVGMNVFFTLSRNESRGIKNKEGILLTAFRRYHSWHFAGHTFVGGCHRSSKVKYL